MIFSVEGYGSSLEGGGERPAPVGRASGTVDEDREEPDPGNENMYKGILWMKEKYERFRELSDQRYDELKEELHRSEKKYQDLLATIEESKNLVPGPGAGEVGDVGERDAAHGPGVADAEKESMRDLIEEKNRQIVYLQGQLDQRIMNYHQVEHQHNEVRQTLEERQRTIDELEERLRRERDRTEELIAKLQENSNLLLSIHKELDKTLHPENG